MSYIVVALIFFSIGAAAGSVAEAIRKPGGVYISEGYFDDGTA